jgi:hypothetical protein
MKRVEAPLNLMEDILSTFTINVFFQCFRTRVNMDIQYFLVLICGTRTQNLSGPVSYNLYNFIY